LNDEGTLVMNIAISRAAFLDFDGVLFDTVREAYVISIVALGRSGRVADIDFNSKYFKKFNQFRYLIGPAWNYYYLTQAIDKAITHSVDDLEVEYRKLLNQWARGAHRSFEKNFFRARKRLRETDRDYWLSLISPYNLVKNIRGLVSEFRGQIFLVTTRDRESVLDILSLHNVEIPESNIFSKNEFMLRKSKANIVQDLINQYQIERALFIDDLEEHLVACEAIENVSTLQATWGYVVPEKKEDNSTFLLKELGRFLHGENVWA